MTKTWYSTLRNANRARQDEWDPEGILNNLDWRVNELFGEVGELCNVVKKLERERLGLPGSLASLADLAAEIADVVICVDLVALTSENREFDLEVIESEACGVHYATSPDFSILRRLNSNCSILSENLFGSRSNLSRVQQNDMTRAIECCSVLSSKYGIDLKEAVQNKFNATSEKVGLKTRLGFLAP